MNATTCGLWLWNSTDITLNALRAYAAAGVTRIYAKYGDGNNIFPQYDPATLKSIFQEVYGWHYIYGLPYEQAPVKAIAGKGLDGWVVDAESEYETQTTYGANNYMIPALQALGSTPIFLSSFGFPNVHAGIDWLNWDKLVAGYMPQIFPNYTGWSGIPQAITAVYNAYQAQGVIKPIHPLGELMVSPSDSTISCSDVQDFYENVKAGGYTHASFWRTGILPDSNCFAGFLSPTPTPPLTIEQRLDKIERFLAAQPNWSSFS